MSEQGGSPEIEVWYQPSHGSPQPTFSFPSIAPTLVASPLASNSPFLDSAPFMTKQGSTPLVAPRPIHPSSAPNLGWRDAGALPKPKRKTTAQLQQEVVRGQQLKWGLIGVGSLVLLYYLAGGALWSTGNEEGTRSRLPTLFQVRTETCWMSEIRGVQADRIIEHAQSSRRLTRQEAESFRQELDPELNYLTSPVAGNLGQPQLHDHA